MTTTGPQGPGPCFVNQGFQAAEERPPPFNPSTGLYPQLPQGQSPQLPQEHPSTLPQYAPQSPPDVSANIPPLATVPVHTTIPPQAATTPPLATVPPPTTVPISTPEDTEPAPDCKSAKAITCIVTALGSVLLLLVVAGVLLWYFLSSMCASGLTCGDGGQCISASLWCDGVMHCPAGEDEAQCFRLYGSRFLLQAYSGQRRLWMPVCAEGWNKNFGMSTCEQLGYDRETYVASGEMTSFDTDDYMQLDFGSDPGAPLQQNLISSESCYANRVVMLRCIECGHRDIPPRSRIVGGEIASEGSWPWQVSLWAGGQHMCGGSIITPDWIVTAAHCLDIFNLPGDWTVYAGYLDQYEMLMNKGSSVSRLLSHAYDSLTNNNDVALMKLSQPLNMSDSVKPVCLPNVGQDFAGSRECWISGWGAIREMGPSSRFLREAQVPLIDRPVCNLPLMYNGEITDTMICAGYLAGGVDSCQGDSGGPLVTEEGSVWWLVGDTSWGYGCGLPNNPGVYGNMSAFLSWIYKQMKKYT